MSAIIPSGGMCSVCFVISLAHATVLAVVSGECSVVRCSSMVARFILNSKCGAVGYHKNLERTRL